MGSMSKWDGTLLPNDFDSSVAALCERWREVNTALPQWLWMPCHMIGVSSYNAAGYLAMESVYLQSSTEVGLGSDCEKSLSAEPESSDEATLAQSCKEDMHVYDYHIVYSFIFRVPVLYFRGYKCDGTSLKLDDIEKDLSAYSLKLLRESKWTFITQEDHPYLHRPWYTLHPCGTADWMKHLLGDDEPKKDQQLRHYLSAWLSVVGQAVGLIIPLELFMQL